MKINLKEGITTHIRGLFRYDFGQTLEVYNTKLNIDNIEFQFIQNGEQIDQLGQYNSELDCYTVSIPDKFLQNIENIECYIYVEDTEKGETKKVIILSIYDREMYEPVPDEKTKSLLSEIMEKLNSLQDQLDNFQLTEEQLASIMSQVITELGNNYYTSDQTDTAISEAISKIDFSGYITTEQFTTFQENVGKSFSSMSQTIDNQNNKFSEVNQQIMNLTNTVNTLKEEVETANAVLETI